MNTDFALEMGYISTFGAACQSCETIGPAWDVGGTTKKAWKFFNLLITLYNYF